MKKIFGLFVAALLAGCAASSVGTTASQLQQICQAGAPLIQQVSAKTGTSATAQNLLAYAQASCAADGTVAATLAPNVTPTTPTWLENVLQGLQVAAQVAPIVLPLLR